MRAIAEDDLESAALSWLEGLGWSIRNGLELSMGYILRKQAPV